MNMIIGINYPTITENLICGFEGALCFAPQTSVNLNHSIDLV